MHAGGSAEDVGGGQSGDDGPGPLSGTCVVDPLPTVRDIVAGIDAGTLDPAQLVRDCIQRYDALEPGVAAWRCFDGAGALAANLSGAEGPLRGVPFGVKDVIDTADLPTEYGSDAYAGNRPRADASCVALAGTVVLGKTVTTEFAGAAAGPTRNPHNAAPTPGGSSSGSAAAVAAGMVPVALGTQTSGSSIRPASFCGCVGYKPPPGLIDVVGGKTLATTFDTIGILSRTVDCAALFASVLARRPALAAFALERPPQISLYRTTYWDQAEQPSRDVLEDAATALRDAGLQIGEAAPPPSHADLHALHRTIFQWDLVSGLAWERLAGQASIRAVTRSMLTTAARIDVEAADQARTSAQRARDDVDLLFGSADVLLTPAATGEAPRASSMTATRSSTRRGPSSAFPASRSPAARDCRSACRSSAAGATTPAPSRSPRSSRAGSRRPSANTFEILMVKRQERSLDRMVLCSIPSYSISVQPSTWERS